MRPLLPLLLALAAQSGPADPAAEIRADALKDHLANAASSRDRALDAFRKLGLKTTAKSSLACATLAGGDPKLAKEWIVICAGDPSGAAAALEIARVLAEHKRLAKRSVAFTWLDAGDAGARAFAAAPPVPLADVACVLVLDRPGRELGPAEGLAFVLGTERVASIREIAKKSDERPLLAAACVGADLLGAEPALAPFAAHKIAAVILTSGDPKSAAPSADAAVLARHARLAFRMALAAANAPARPALSNAPPDLEEVKCLANVIEQLSRKRATLSLTDDDVDHLASLARTVESLLKKGSVAPADRDALKPAVADLLERIRRW